MRVLKEFSLSKNEACLVNIVLIVFAVAMFINGLLMLLNEFIIVGIVQLILVLFSLASMAVLRMTYKKESVIIADNTAQTSESKSESVRDDASALEATLRRLKAEIYEREKRETLIRESEERFRSLVESSPNSIILTDSDGYIRIINKQTEVLFGYQRHEIIGKTIETLLPDRYRANHFGYRSDFYQHPQIRPMGVGRDLYGKHKEGCEIPVEIGLTPIKSQDKLMVLSTIVDITERKKNEEKLMQKNEELAKFNEELKSRTAQLIQSEKMSALGTLIAGVAHELNNPITGILNYSQYCRKNIPSDGKLAEVLDDLVVEAKRCADIVKNLLTYSYFSTGKNEKTTDVSTDLNEIIKRIRNLFANLLTDVTVHLSIENNLPPLRIQPNKLQQVVSNIIKNSIDAMENQEKKEIIIKAFRDKTYCNLVIEDTGMGIKADDFSKIFDPFYTTKEVGKGTGLGLSVSKSIVEEYNGEITLESEVGKGTRFYVKLPLNN